MTDENRCNSAASVSVSSADSSFLAYSCAGVSSYAKVSGPLYGAYFSSNGGKSWSLADLPYGLELSRIQLFGQAADGQGIIVTSAKGRRVPIAAGNGSYYELNLKQGGIWISKDSGSSFSECGHPLVSGVSIHELQVDYQHSSIYAYDWKGNLLLSTDFGESFKILQAALTDFGTGVALGALVNFRISISYASGLPQPTILTMICDYFDHGVLQWTMDQGKTWASVAIPADIPQYSGINFFALLAHPTIPNLAFIGGALDSVYQFNISQPLDSSAFTSLFGGSLHPDHRFFYYDSTHNVLLLSCDGGLWGLKQPELATSNEWIPMNGNLQITELNSLSYEPHHNIMASGSQDNGVWISNYSSNNPFAAFYPGDGEAVGFNTAASPPILYYAFQGLNYVYMYTIGTSVNSPQTGYFPLKNENYYSSMIKINSANESYQLLCINPGCIEVYFHDPSNPQSIVQTMIDPSLMISDYFYGGSRHGVGDPNVLFAIYSNRTMFAADSQGSNTYTINDEWFLDPGFFGILPLRISHNPSDFYQIVAVTTESKIFFTESFGSQWEEITGNLFQVTQSIDQPFAWGSSIIPVFGGKDTAILVGTALGIYVSYQSQLSSWVLLGTGLPNTLVSTMHYSPENELLMVATFGRGWWILEDPVKRLEELYDKILKE